MSAKLEYQRINSQLRNQIEVLATREEIYSICSKCQSIFNYETASNLQLLYLLEEIELRKVN